MLGWQSIFHFQNRSLECGIMYRGCCKGTELYCNCSQCSGVFTQQLNPIYQLLHLYSCGANVNHKKEIQINTIFFTSNTNLFLFVPLLSDLNNTKKLTADIYRVFTAVCQYKKVHLNSHIHRKYLRIINQRYM